MQNSQENKVMRYTNGIAIYRQMFLTVLLIAGIISAFQFTASAQPNFIKAGRPDFTFNPPRQYVPISTSVPTLIVQPDGKILAVGRFRPNLENTVSEHLIRFLPNGSIDTGFNPNFPVGLRISNFALQADGKILYCYETPSINGGFTISLFRLNADGTPDNSFNFVHQNYNGAIRSILPLSNGKILVTGRFPDETSGITFLPIVRLNENGSRDTTFNSDVRVNRGFQFESAGGVLRVLPNNKLLLSILGGVNAVQNRLIVRLNENGIFEPEFNPVLPTGSTSRILQIEIQNNAKILIAGSVFNTTNQPYLLRFNLDGTADNGFQVTFSGGFLSLQTDGKIFVGTRRLLSDGALDIDFAPQIFQNGAAFPQPDGKIYLRGDFLNPNIPVGIVRIHGNKTPPVNKAFDFDGDGKADIGVFRPSNGTWYWLNSSNGSFSVLQFGLNDDKPVPADYDGDGKTDIAVFRPSNGVWYGIRSSSGQVFIQQFGIAEDSPIPTDFDGDAKDDIAVFRPSNGTWYHLNSSNSGFSARRFGTNGDFPLIGDLDGDLKSDLIIWRPSNVNVFSVSSSNDRFSQSQLGFIGDKPIFSDYDQDGRTDFGIWRSTGGGWYLYRSFFGGSTYAKWGIDGDVPVSADYDGDGKPDLAVFRPLTRTWWIVRSGDSTVSSTFFGLSNDVPLQSVYTR